MYERFKKVTDRKNISDQVREALRMFVEEKERILAK